MKQFQIDAFTDRLFAGNPAAIVPLEAWLDEALMQSIARENNLSETAFFVPVAGGYQLRWFTPNSEVDLCGHATLAAAYVLFKELGYQGESLRFHTRSGELTVINHGKHMEMDFPSQLSTPCAAPQALLEGLGVEPVEVLVAEDYLVVLESEQQVRAAMKVIHTIGGADVFFVASVNGTESMPPELQRRFNCGTWFFDSLNAAGRAEVWDINRDKYGVTEEFTGNDDDFTGADIRNICSMAYNLGITPDEALEYVVPMKTQSPRALEDARTWATGRFLCATAGGVYKPGKAQAEDNGQFRRTVSLED